MALKLRAPCLEMRLGRGGGPSVFIVAVRGVVGYGWLSLSSLAVENPPCSGSQSAIKFYAGPNCEVDARN
jgi:hypothetical protein